MLAHLKHPFSSGRDAMWRALTDLFILLGALSLLSVPLFAQQAPTTLPPGGGCVTAECHGDTQKHEFLHGPANLGQCVPCHIPKGNRHEFEPQAEGTALCLVCHDTQASMDVVHAPFQTDCTSCHNPHGGENRYFVRGGLGAEGCNMCHTDVREGISHIHGPVALGECLACHTPHQSQHEGLLIEPRQDLCLGCHIDIEETLDAAVSVHEPVQQECAGCHFAHGGNEESFLVATGSQLCQECHSDFLQEVSQVAFPHEPMVEGKACQNCHTAHASNQVSLLSGKVGDLCLSCHSEELITDTESIDNVAAQIESSEFLHGPLREGNCAACHAAHGSDHPQILDKAFPAGFYESYEPGAYDLCFDCHDQTLVLEAKSTATGFRNGDQNLHYLHVNREKGRSCRACHHEHASNQPNHVRSEVPFGRWSMQVEFTKNDQGGTCSTGCHLPYRYDRVDAINNQEILPQ